MVQTDSPDEAQGEGGRRPRISGTLPTAIHAVRHAWTALSGLLGGVAETNPAWHGR